MIATGNHLRFRIRCALQHAPTFADGHGGHPERDVEGAVPYEGAVEMVRCHRRALCNTPPAGCDLKYWERVKFQTDKPSTAVSNPSVKNRLRRADFCHLPLHKGGMGALRTRRILAGAVGGGRVQAGG